MAFGARQETDGKWRLCLRKGRTITGTDMDDGTRADFEFGSQRRAKACADELNEVFWERYRKNPWPKSPDWAIDMINTIRKHCL